VQLFDATTLAKIGATAVYSSNVGGLAFDEGGAHLIITTGPKVTSRSVLDFSETVAPVARHSELLATPIVDTTRGRIYLGGGFLAKLIVLDATTLEHVIGSPVSLPKAGTPIGVY